ncbi:hypothetical protein SLS58_000010 [Diplodia intermedia]|uniref:Uncharacterized protein n=1 Tax=Diplodia intermedia TaxID=856260 RepID=A0ABR3U4I8_9PEZI
MKKRASVLSSFSDISGVQRKASVAELKSYRRKLLLASDTSTTGQRRESGDVDVDDDDEQRQRSSDAARSVLSSTSSRNSTSALAVVESGSSRRRSRSRSRSASGIGTGAVARVAQPKVAEKLNGAEKLDRFAEGVATSGKSLARGLGFVLSAPGVYTHEIARGINNLPRRYGDETVRRDDEIVGFTSGMAAAGKGFGLGLYDGITGIFVQPVTGAQKEGAKGFVKGCVKGVAGAVTKPAAGK